MEALLFVPDRDGWTRSGILAATTTRLAMIVVFTTPFAVAMLVLRQDRWYLARRRSAARRTGSIRPTESIR